MTLREYIWVIVHPSNINIWPACPVSLSDWSIKHGEMFVYKMFDMMKRIAKSNLEKMRLLEWIRELNTPTFVCASLSSSKN